MFCQHCGEQHRAIESQTKEEQDFEELNRNLDSVGILKVWTHIIFIPLIIAFLYFNIKNLMTLSEMDALTNLSLVSFIIGFIEILFLYVAIVALCNAVMNNNYFIYKIKKNKNQKGEK